MDVAQKISSDRDLVEWLKYGFKYLTGLTCDSVPQIVKYLKSVLNYSDKDIMSLAQATYCFNRNGKVMRYA